MHAKIVCLEKPSVSSKTKKGKYPYSRLRVYTSVATAVLSVILGVLLLESMPIFLLYYFICTLLIAAIIFALNFHLLFIRAPKPSEETILQTEKGASQWKALILLFCILLASLLAPLLLTQVLPHEIWFILIISFTSGASIAEIFFYLHTR